MWSGCVVVNVCQGDASALPLLNSTVNLVIGSPPYGKARTYGLTNAARDNQNWADWMTRCTVEALRVSNGPVLWVVAGTGNYNPLPEMLLLRVYNLGIKVLRPCIWTKNAPPTGSGWFSNDWEYVLAFTNTWPLPYWNPTELSIPIKYKTGGKFRQRRKDGTRSVGGKYPQHALRKRPSNVFHVTVGGGHLGHPLAHENEAPYPEALVTPFIKALCPPGGVVLDPFCGSGTTLVAAHKLGYNAIGVDIRKSQVELTMRRLKEECNYAV
jgi:DNA modification methylase